jgi:uncharacterized membrane protein
MLQVFLLLHVLGAIFVFGPTVAFTFLANENQRLPGHGHFAAVVGDAIERKVVLPGAVVQGVTGVCLILLAGFDLTQPSSRWLVGGLILYAIAIVFAFAVQAPNAARMVELTRTPPAPQPGAAPAGPPPEIMALGRKLARGGMLLTVMIVLIVTLMVLKPGV